MTIKNIIQYLETIAPPIYQESYDNAGLIVGDATRTATGVLCCLDSTEAVVEEAIQKNCNLIIAHHPIVFKGLKRFNGRNYVERVVIKAIKNDIAIYAIHTNLDNMLYQGVNTRIAERIGVENTRILAPKQALKKIQIHAEQAILKEIKTDFLAAGVTINMVQKEVVNTLDVVFPTHLRYSLQAILDRKPCHYELIAIENVDPKIGSGMIGELPEAMPEKAFLAHLKERMQVHCIKHTALQGKPIKTVAFCGGAGGFLLRKAIAKKADIFITADYKYHEFFDADNQLIIADIGHYESEQFTIQLLNEVLRQKFSNFAVYCTEVNTNPVKYYF